MTLAYAPTTTPTQEAHVYARVRTLDDGRSGFTRPETGTALVMCDGTWDCPRKRNPRCRMDREHLIDYADLTHA